MCVYSCTDLTSVNSRSGQHSFMWHKAGAQNVCWISAGPGSIQNYYSEIVIFQVSDTEVNRYWNEHSTACRLLSVPEKQCFGKDIAKTSKKQRLLTR